MEIKPVMALNSEENRNTNKRKQFVLSSVRKCKNIEFKTRLQALIAVKGMRELDFYKSLGISRQVWYEISWNKWEASDWLKKKIAEGLGVDSRVIWP